MKYTQNKAGHEMTLNKGYLSPPKLGQKVTRDISGCGTGYFFKLSSLVAVVAMGYILAKLSRVISRVTLAPKIVTGYWVRQGLLFRKLARVTPKLSREKKNDVYGYIVYYILK